MRQVSGVCLFVEHRRCSGTFDDFGTEQTCMCPCHYDVVTHRRTARSMSMSTRASGRPPLFAASQRSHRAHPQGQTAAQSARSLLLLIAVAVLVYLALCALTTAAANAAVPLLS